MPVHEARTAATPRAELEVINRANRCSWSGAGEPPTVTGDALRRMPAPTTVSEINERNRQFWAER